MHLLLNQHAGIWGGSYVLGVPPVSQLFDYDLVLKPRVTWGTHMT